MIKSIVMLLVGLAVLLFVIGTLTNTPQSKIARPSDGYALHIDAIKHIAAQPDAVAHHYCKSLPDGIVQCLLYESDDDNAHLLGVENVISSELYQSLAPDEQSSWHYHKMEIPVVDAKLPDLKPEEAAKVVKSLEETYGKVVIFWKPEQNAPIGQPEITFVH